MSRNISSTNRAALVQHAIQYLYFVLFETSPSVRLHSGVGPIVWDGKTWHGLGALGSVDGVSESGDVSHQPVRLILSPLDSSIAALANDDDLINVPVTVYMGMFNGSVLVDDPFIVYAGDVVSLSQTMNAQDGEGDAGFTHGLVIELDRAWSDWDRPNQKVMSHEAHVQRFPNDLFFQQTPKTVNTSWQFGSTTVSNIGVGRGGIIYDY